MRFDEWIKERTRGGEGPRNLSREIDMHEAFKAGVKAERERCAQECERIHKEIAECPELALYCADAIRGQK